MQIRCYRCGWSFAIKREEAAFALEALEESGGTHYDTSCPRCRHSNRVSLEQLKKASPRPPGETEPETAAETAGVTSAQETTDESETESMTEEGEIAGNSDSEA